MERTTVFLPMDLRRKLADESRRRQQPQAVLIREALVQYLARNRAEQPKLVGAVTVEGVDAREAKSWVREEWRRRAREQ